MNGKDSNVRIQNLRDFTVRILHSEKDYIVGTGIAVSTDGKIVTCAHVVEAGGVDPKVINGEELGVYFPQARGGEEKARRARVSACFEEHDDDVVLLQLVGGPVPLAPEQIAILGTAEPSQGNPFRSYGYRPRGQFVSGYADGKIRGHIDAEIDKKYQAEPVELKSDEIDHGMSGSAVLDIERNLVVGIIFSAWLRSSNTKDRQAAWAVDAGVLGLEPFCLEVQDEPYPMRAAPEPRTDIEVAVAADLGVDLERAPASLDEWVGRKDFLKDIGGDWAGTETHVTGLIGFGGEGKSSLARQWLDELLVDEGQPRPDGVFWWGFYTEPSVDKFFEAALEYMVGGRIDPRQLPSANVKAQVLGAMLGKGRYIFILDGLEVMQHEEGDRYGLLKSADLRDFVQFLAGPDHESFCLITSRAPVFDLMDYTTYAHRDVMRLSKEDGRALLQELGVDGSDEKLDAVVSDWDGHALTLGLMGSHIAKKHKGDVAFAAGIEPPTADESRYDRVHRVLRRYDEHLNDAERAFLRLFSAFRLPVERSAFEKVFRIETDADGLNTPIAALNYLEFDEMVSRLVEYRILRYDENECHYTAHPLIHSHYRNQLEECGRTQREAAHERIKDYYLDIAGAMPAIPTLDDLAPLIEAVHHACKAGVYDEASRVFQKRIDQGDRRVLAHMLGAYETRLALFLEFFPEGDTEQDPQVSDPRDKGFILNEVGFSLMNLGRPAEAIPLYERSNAMYLEMENWGYASRICQNLADLHINLGALDPAADTAREALLLAKRTENKQEQSTSLTYQAWIAHLCGDMEAAGQAFKQAESLERGIDPGQRYLYSFSGTCHADYLRRAGDADYARRVTEANMEICLRNHWPNSLNRCHRVLGDLDADAGRHDSAREHYDEALRIVQSITNREVLIQALLARGRWYARHGGDSAAAFNDLNEALDYAVDDGYRIFEADIRIALAWDHKAADDHSSARAEAGRAHRMSEGMGYHWGKVDAEEVLAELEL